MAQRYFENWSDWADMVKDCAGYEYRDGKHAQLPPPEGFPTDAEVLLAWYETPSYEGYAEIFYLREGIIYWAVAGHCSCNSLDEAYVGGQPTTVAEQRDRLRRPHSIPADALGRFKELFA